MAKTNLTHARPPVALVALTLSLVLAGCGAKADVVAQFEPGSAAGGAGVGPAAGGGPAGGPGVTTTTGGEGDGGLAVGAPAGPGAVSGPGGVSSGSGAGSSGGSGGSGTSVGTGTGTTTGGGSGGGTTGTRAGTRTGVTATTIKMGFHVPKHVSGVDFDRVAKITALLEAYWKDVNEKGGVNGRKVEIRVEDDFYDPAAAVQACRNLVAWGAFFISGTGGADQTVACGQYLTKQKIFYGSLGASEKGLDKTPYYFAFSATYDQQAPLQARWIANSLGGKTKNVGFVRANSANFDGAHGKFVSAFKKATGKGLAVDDSVDKNGNANELSTECVKLQQAGVEVVSVLAAPAVLARMAQACQAQGYEPQFTGWANTAACNPDPASTGTPALDGCLTFSNYHSPFSGTTEVGKTCREAFQKYSAAEYGEYPNGGENICGYMDVLREALQRAGKDLTREHFAATLRAMKYDNGLLNPIDFRGGQFGSDKVVIWKGDSSCRCTPEVDRRWRNDF
jgi:branched-chain amino acid transport system substrate-binding protein